MQSVGRFSKHSGSFQPPLLTVFFMKLNVVMPVPPGAQGQTTRGTQISLQPTFQRDFSSHTSTIDDSHTLPQGSPARRLAHNRRNATGAAIVSRIVISSL